MGKQVSLYDIRRRYHAEYLEARRLSRLVNSDRFAQAYALKSGDVDFIDLELWVEETLRKELEEMSLRNLREIARKLGVVKYTMYSRINLIMKVKNVIESTKTTSTVPHQEVTPGPGVAESSVS